ncbi:MAG: hypothetical protein Q9227_008772 [Pyrenula ochraceoflavens]
MPKDPLAAYKALRAAGKKRTYVVEDAAPVYEEIDDERYKNLVRSRLDQDDFVVDDNGDGYADDGREDWQTEQGYYNSSEEEEVAPLPAKAAKRKREEEQERIEKSNKNIANYFNNAPTAPPKPKVQATAKDEEWMTGMLNEMNANLPQRFSPPKKLVKSETRRKVRLVSPPPSGRTKVKHTRKMASEPQSMLAETPPSNSNFDNDDGDILMNGDDVMSDHAPSSPLSKAVERKNVTQLKEENIDSEEDVMDVMPAFGDETVTTPSVNIAGNKAKPKPIKNAYPSPRSSSPPEPSSSHIDPSAWNEVANKLNVVSSGPASDTQMFGKMRPQDAVEDDGSLRMFWLDYTEVNGSLCLFGKVRHKENGKFVSAFLKVDNILRKLYFLPRDYKQKNGRDTSDEVGMEDVYEEVDSIMSRLKVGMHKIKDCNRKYAFEIPTIPKNGQYLKLLYPYDKQQLPMDLQGETFSHVFGTNTSLFEQFVLWRNIMGPCWLKIDGADFTSVNNASWCKLECSVTNPATISPIPEQENLETPRLTLMSIALRTQLNIKENKQEILVASARVYENVSLTDTTAPEKMPSTTFTVMRPSGSAFPVGFEGETKKQRGTFNLEKSEAMLLSKFLALFERTDPDVLMGHQLQEVEYGILLSRLRERKTPGWSRIGRLKRVDWPKNFNKAGGSFFAERQLVAGRLMCDLANDMGKSITTKCQQWSLTEMCQLYLGGGNLRQELDNEEALKTWAATKDGLMNYIRHCDADTFFVAALVLKLQMLPLTRVLTNLAGNSWARTLSGTRAERNEYILLHEFYRNKYICPDKIYGKSRAKSDDEIAVEGDEAVDTKKKDKYKGGLVFEPEKGLYDKFILVMDFNSLYPSIIQEYNICFTTVDRTETAENENEERVPEIPVDQPQGVLPKLIANLVSRRREVKKLMKDKTATQEQLALWDTKQLALKLTANSMYGCLGYTQSRFYARPLAMLTTFKGREILRSTKDLAESNSLQVIYGDTDSVMINSNADSVAAALKVGNDFKRSVNERYKLLEIDIDNIFSRLLLHAKKKYAAVNLTEIDGKWQEKLEVKGLDMKRREYCQLSKEASSQLLKEILSGNEQDVVLENIHAYLRELSEKMRANSLPASKYTIFTKLGKNPTEYPNSDSMPQVQVALREIAKGKSIRVNDVISYIVTLGDAQTASLPPPKRSYTVQDVVKPGSGLQPDVEYYLLKQIFPPIERLCAPVPGTDSVRLAECLGLDTRKYQISSSAQANQQNVEIFPLESQIPDNVRFKDAAKLKLRCRACRVESEFGGLVESANLCTPSGLRCAKSGCGSYFAAISIIAQLESQIREQTSQYYEGWLVCDDCGLRTRQMSVYGHRCLGPQGRAEGCRGRMTYEYTERRMYNQLLYYASLWDVEKAKEKAKALKDDTELRDRITVLAETNRTMFGTLRGVVEVYLKKCGRQWVEMDTLFAFALR